MEARTKSLCSRSAQQQDIFVSCGGRSCCDKRMNAVTLSRDEEAPAVPVVKRMVSRKSECVLTLASVGFLGFASAEMTYAFAANSLALLGDAAAMMVDALTYVMNLIAIKRGRRRGEFARESRCALFGPFLSALALMGVMVYILIDALAELRGQGKGPSVKLEVVLFFGIANLCLDVFNLVLFWAFPSAYRSIFFFRDPIQEEQGSLNIRSALTHVLADTYRSVAVVVSSSIALTVKHVDPDRADALGAIVVEIPVLFMTLQICTAVLQKITQENNKKRRENDSQILASSGHNTTLDDDDDAAANTLTQPLVTAPEDPRELQQENNYAPPPSSPTSTTTTLV